MVSLRLSSLAVASALVLAAPASAAALINYMQFFQSNNNRVFSYTPLGSGSQLMVSGGLGQAVAQAFVKAPYSVGDTFNGTFTLMASSSSEVIFTGFSFEQPGFSGVFNFTAGGVDVLTLNFGGGVLTRTIGTTPTVSLLAMCPCGITYTSDVFALPSGLKDFAFALTSLQGAAWNPLVAVKGAGYYGVGFEAVGTGTFAAIPEPATWALLISGFGLVGLAARRRTARVAA